MSPIYTPGKLTLSKSYTAGDSQFSNVQLLLQGNGNTTDSSPSPKTMIAVGMTTGNPSGSPTPYPASSSSFAQALYFDGSTSYLRASATANSVWDFGATTFTIEFWIYPSRVNTVQVIAFHGPANSGGGTGGFSSFINASGQVAFDPGTPQVFTDLVVSANVWSHIAYVGNSGTLSAYLNGTKSGSTASYSITARPSDPLVIGGYNTQPDNTTATRLFYQGYIDDFRITSNVARYNSSFTAPTAPFPNALY